MAGRGNSYARGASRGRAGGSFRSGYQQSSYKATPKEDKGIPAVGWPEQFNNWVNRPYPSESGNSFMMRGGARDDKDLLNSSSLSKRLDMHRFEGYNRPGVFLSTAAGTFQEGRTYLQKYTRDTAALERTGIPRVTDFLFDTESCFADLNASNKNPPESLEDAIIKFFKIVGDENYPEEDVIKMTIFSKKIFDLGMGLQQARAMIVDREKLADEMARQKDQQPRHSRRFMQDPKDDRAFVEAMTACYEEQVLEGQKSKVTRRGLSDDEGDVAPRVARRRDDSDEDPLTSRRSAAIFGGGRSAEDARRAKSTRVGDSRSPRRSRSRGEKRAEDARRAKSTRVGDSRSPRRSRSQGEKRSIFGQVKRGPEKRNSRSPRQRAEERCRSIFGPVPRSPEKQEERSKAESASAPKLDDGRAPEYSTELTPSIMQKWTVKDIADFETEAQIEAQNLDMKCLEHKQRFEVFQKLPDAIQGLVLARAGVSKAMNKAEMEKTLAEDNHIEEVQKHIVTAIQEVRMAWIQQAIEEDTQPVHFMEEYQCGGILKALAGLEDAPPDLIAKSALIDERLAKAQAQELAGMITYQDSVLAMMNVLNFAETYKFSKEPNKDQLVAIINLLPDNLREALEIPSKAKVSSLNTRPRKWQQLASKTYSAIVLIMEAHTTGQTIRASQQE